MEYRCAQEPQKLHYRSFCPREPQKPRFWTFCGQGTPENLVLYKARWSIAAHRNLRNSTTGVSAHRNLKNSVLGVSAHRVRKKTLFPIRYGGVSLCTGTSKLHNWSFCAQEPQKPHFWSFCARGARENFVPNKARWSIAAHGNLKSSTTRVSAHRNLRNSILGVSAHRVRQKTSFNIRCGGVSLCTGTQKLHYWSFCAREPQKPRFWSFCARGAPENLVLYKARWSIAVHGNSETPLPEFLRTGTSETTFLEFLRTGCTRKPRSL